MDKKVNLYEIHSLPMFENLALSQLENSQDMWSKIQGIKTGTLDREQMERTRRLYEERLEFIDAFREQIYYWRKSKGLTSTQKEKISNLEKVNNNDEDICNKIIEKVESTISIDDIYEMDPIELSLKKLLGEI